MRVRMCPRCQNRVAWTADYCGNCGNRLDDVQVVQQGRPPKQGGSSVGAALVLIAGMIGVGWFIMNRSPNPAAPAVPPVGSPPAPSTPSPIASIPQPAPDPESINRQSSDTSKADASSESLKERAERERQRTIELRRERKTHKAPSNR